MLLYHGSVLAVEQPRILRSERMLDFGMGFYTTMNREQAVRWSERVAARQKVPTRILSIYDFDFEQAKEHLHIQRFDRADAAWLDFVSACRSGKEPCEEYDIVWGPVADDRVYAAIQLYENGLISQDETLERLKIQPLFNQVLFHTERSLKYCRFREAESL